jgi:hypothetical protein
LIAEISPIVVMWPAVGRGKILKNKRGIRVASLGAYDVAFKGRACGRSADPVGHHRQRLDIRLANDGGGC